MENLPKELQGLSEEELRVAKEILSQLATEGKSEKLDDLKYADYAEIPVDIETFLHERQYLGNALYDQDGRFTLFPYWEEKLKEIFPTNTETAYNTVIFTGAIGLGKSTIAVICLLYMLYRLLCLKDPYLHFGLQPVDKITVSLMNITIENAKGVAGDKMNQMILSSSWFMSHGEMNGTSNLSYKPNKHIEVVAASSNNQVIGRAIYCLDGDTVISTSTGSYKIKDLVYKPIRVYTVGEDKKQTLSDICCVKPTIRTNCECRVTLEDGTVIRCTANHRLMLHDGAYKEAFTLHSGDRLYSVGFNSMVVKSVDTVKLYEKKQFYDVVECNPNHNFIIKTITGEIVSHNCNFSDEVNWGITNDTEKLKKKYKQLIAQIDARMKSRFLRGTYLPTMNIIASSKNNEQSFLDEYINLKKKNESKNTLIVDEPQWVVDNRKDTKEKFFVAIGNRFLANELLPRDASEILLDEYRAKGYSILKVPMGYLEDFQQNIDQALMDIAGIATASATKYISGVRWNEIKNDKYQNPFVKEIIEVGTAKDDIAQYSDFFDISRIPPEIRHKPIYLHLDLSVKGDKTGIGAVAAIGKKPSVEGADASRDMIYRIVFSVSVQAPKGYEISFDKSRTFVRWLRENGFNIKGVSFDSFASPQLKQQLIADGFVAQTISVDRLDPETKQCLPYAYFKSTVYERRIEVYADCPFLTEEVLGLERELDGHVNHPDNGKNGSKDAIDAIVGALYHASQHAEEYAYDYGESIDVMLESNQDEGINQAKEQATVDFAQELQKVIMQNRSISTLHQEEAQHQDLHDNGFYDVVI